MSELAPDLVERVLSKLGLSSAPAPDLAGLGLLYGAWCRGVPFDNVRKLIHLHESSPGPLPGDEPTDFFAAWLLHGTGGTCWAGNGALYALLASLGFDARRGYATMLAPNDGPPNHGTVIVAIEGRDHLVDASILFDRPLPLEAGARVDHPAWGVALRAEADGLRVRWRPFVTTLDCRLDATDVGRAEFQRLHEATRAWGPFNFALSARRNGTDDVVGVAFGQLATLDRRGALSTQASPSAEARIGWLVDRLGISEAMAARLPPDRPMPPRPA